MIRRILILLTTSAFLQSCSENDNNSKPNIKVQLDNSGSTLLSDFFDDIDYILLDESDEFPIVKPYKVVFYNGLIIVHDNVLDNLHLFDFNGKNRTILKSLGQGPMEFSHIEDFVLYGDSLIIKDNVLKKLIYFNLKGDILGESKSLISSSEFFYTPKMQLHFMDNRDEFNFLRLDENENISDKYYLVSKHLNGFHFKSITGFYRDKFRNRILFNIPYTYHIAIFSLLGNLDSIIEIDLGRASMDQETLSRYNKGFERRAFVEENNLSEMITCFFPFENGYFLFLVQGKGNYHFIFLDEKMNVRKQSKLFKNDLDGMKIRTIPWTFTDEHIVFTSSSIDILNDFMEREAEIREKYSNSSIIKFIEKNKDKLASEKTVLILLKVSKALNSQE